MVTQEQIRAVQQQATIIVQTGNQLLRLCQVANAKIQVARTFTKLTPADIEQGAEEIFQSYKDLKATLKQQVEALP